MEPTVRPSLGLVGAPVQYPRPAGVRVDHALGRELGISWQRAHRILYEVPRLVDVVAAAGRAYVTAGDVRGLMHLRAAAEAAGLPARPAPTNVLAISAAEADGRTEPALATYQAHPSRDHALALVRAIDRQQLTAAAFRAALVEEHAL